MKIQISFSERETNIINELGEGEIFHSTEFSVKHIEKGKQVVLNGENKFVEIIFIESEKVIADKVYIEEK